MCLHGGSRTQKFEALTICEGGGSLELYRKRPKNVRGGIGDLRQENDNRHFHIQEMHINRLPVKAKEKDVLPY